MWLFYHKQRYNNIREKKTRAKNEPLALRRFMLKTNQEVEERPNCFGKLYDGAAPECVGGHDAAYSDPESGSRVRPRCNFVSTCAVHMQASRQITHHPNLVPASNLTRPPTTFNQPVAQRPWTPPAGYQGPPTVQSHWQGSTNQPRYYVEQYLTVRQPVAPGQTLAKRLFWESLRSMGKSLGHTIAHFFDNEIVGGRPPDRQ